MGGAANADILEVEPDPFPEGTDSIDAGEEAVRVAARLDDLSGTVPALGSVLIGKGHKATVWYFNDYTVVGGVVG